MKRLYRRPTHCVHGHRFSEKNTYTRKDGHRQCRACARRRTREYQAKLRAEGMNVQLSPEWFRDYRRQIKQGVRVKTPRPKPKRVVTENLLDLLEIDGGWLTADGIADVLKIPEPTISRTLYRLRTRNLVRYRNVELALSSHGRMQSRAEWKAA